MRPTDDDDAEYQWNDSVVGGGCGSHLRRPESMFRDLTEHKERRRRHTMLAGAAAVAVFLFSFVLYVIVATERVLKQPPPPQSKLTGTYSFSKWEGDTLGYLTSLDLSQFIAAIVIHRT